MKDPKNPEHDSDQAPEAPEQVPGKTDETESPQQQGPHSESPPPRPDDDGKRPWRRISKTLAFWVFFLLVAIFASKFFGSDQTTRVELSYKEYKRLLQEDKITTATIMENEFYGQLIEEELSPPTRGQQRPYREFVVNLGVVGPETIAEWEKHGIDFRFETKPIQWLNVFFNFLPWLLFVGLWLFILRQMQGGPKGAFSFGKSKAKLVSEDKKDEENK